MHHSTTVNTQGNGTTGCTVVHHPVSLCKPNNDGKIFHGMILYIRKKSGCLTNWLLVYFVSSTCGSSRRLQQYTRLHISNQPSRTSQSISPDATESLLTSQESACLEGEVRAGTRGRASPPPRRNASSPAVWLLGAALFRTVQPLGGRAPSLPIDCVKYRQQGP